MDIFFDESGYTGRALLDAEQPFFSVVSTNMPQHEAQALLSEAFPAFKGDEAKFSTLWRRENNRAGFARIGQAIARGELKAFGWVVDKRYCVFQKLVDFLIEPEIHDAGFDFYANGHAPKFCNYAHDLIAFTGPDGLYTRLTDAYDRFSRRPMEDELILLQGELEIMAETSGDDLQGLLDLAHTGAMRFHEHHDMDTFQDTFEIQLTSILASVGYWRQQTREPLRIVHDASTNFFNQEELWRRITATDAPARLQPVANSVPLEFPLRITETLAADSKANPSIQLADLIAGAMTRLHINREEERPALRDLIEAGFGELIVNGIRPQQDYPDSPPPKLNGPDAVDQMVELMNPDLFRRPS